jgi:hypothetical protein
MRTAEYITVQRVKSEPGDCILYDYIYVRNGEDFMFAPCGSTFSFPQRLNYWEVHDLNTVEDCRDYVEKSKTLKHVNPHTLFECVNLIKEVY